MSLTEGSAAGSGRTEKIQQNKPKRCPQESGEDSDTDEGLGAGTRPRKMKARRGRRKAYKPYYQLSEEERRVREERERMRDLKQQERMLAKGRITAPYNTTQFLMNDNRADNILLQLEQKPEARKKKQRSRHSSFSTEEEARDEMEEESEDFISGQFQADYQLQNMNRLETMNKEMLMSEYVLLERKNEALEEKLEFMRGQEEEKARRGLVDYDFEKGEVPMDPETAAKIKIFQREIERLQSENTRLTTENSEMNSSLQTKNKTNWESPDSLSSSYEDKGTSKKGDVPRKDTGYESI